MILFTLKKLEMVKTGRFYIFLIPTNSF